MFIGLPSFYGAWLHFVFNLTQHAGLAEDVLDHRLNTRTVYMNPIFRFIYWNMNYHVEHHMFPMVPYYALPECMKRSRPYLPPAHRGLIETYREIIPTLARQIKDPGYYVERRLPTFARAVLNSRLQIPVFATPPSSPMRLTTGGAGQSGAVTRRNVSVDAARHKGRASADPQLRKAGVAAMNAEKKVGPSGSACSTLSIIARPTACRWTSAARLRAACTSSLRRKTAGSLRPRKTAREGVRSLSDARPY